MHMSKNLRAWQFSALRKNMAHYRRMQEDYCIQGKSVVLLDQGYRAFSLVSPPLDSPVTRRRVRIIVDNMIKSHAFGENFTPLPPVNRTPHVVTIAVSYDCQCRCRHCSAAAYRKEVARNCSALKPEELKNIITQAVAMGTTCVVLTGGEPLLLPEIGDLIEAVDKNKSICTLFTNGEFLDAAAAAIIPMPSGTTATGSDPAFSTKQLTRLKLRRLPVF
jgi:sulfatase maturation enzyme AslB (radical SAM superfamily)